jgi:MinD-like ATPase involved in chromosome partitioning or flagellar assembly
VRRQRVKFANTEERQNEVVAVTNNEIESAEDALHNIESKEDRQLYNDRRIDNYIMI